MRGDPEREEPVDVAFDAIKHQTEKAFLVEVEGEEAWVAKKLVDNAEELEEDLRKPRHQRSVDTISVPKWLAVNNGWIDDE